MPKGNPKGGRQARAQRNKGKEGVGRPSHIDNPATMELILEAARLGKTPNQASLHARITRNSVSDWISRAQAEMAEGLEEEDSKYIKFYYDWHQALEQGRSAVLKAMMEHKSPQALDRWLTRTDREQEFLDQDKKYQADTRVPLLEFNQNVEGDVRIGLSRAKERLDEQRRQKALDRNLPEPVVVDGEMREIDEEE